MSFRRPWLVIDDPMPKSELRAGMARATWRSLPDASELGLIGLRETYATRAHARTLLDLGILLDALTGDGPTQWRAAVEFAKASHGRCTLDIGRRSTRDLLLFISQGPELFGPMLLQYIGRPIPADASSEMRIIAHALVDRVDTLGEFTATGEAERSGSIQGWVLIDARGAIASQGRLAASLKLEKGEPFTIPIALEEEVEITVHLDGPYYDTHDYRVGMGVATVDGRHWRVIGVDMLFDAVSHQTASVRLKLRRDRMSERLQAAAEKNGYVAHQVDGERIKFRAAMRDDANARAPREDEELMRYVEPKPTPPEVRENVKAKKQQRSAIESAVRASVAQRIPPRRGFNAPRRR